LGEQYNKEKLFLADQSFNTKD